MAVALKPKLLIADEPTTALDVTTQAEILDLLRSLQQEDQMALMLISHDLAVVAGMADTVLIMKDGNIVEQGDIEPVFSELKHPYTQALFKASDHVPEQIPAEARALVRQGVERKVSQNIDRSPKPEGDSGNLTTNHQPAPLLDVSNLVVEYRVPGRGWFSRASRFRAVDDVSFCVNAGESVGLVGESGCGKSTLTRAVLGLMSVASGRIAVNGRSIDEGHSVLKDVQVVFQDPYGSFNPRHKVSRLIAEPSERAGHICHRIRNVHSLVANILEDVGLLASDADKYIHEFSGGQRQRIAVARALIIRPALIVLDEAVSALDVSVRATVLDLLASLAATHGLAYLFISHDLSVVRNVTDRVLVMRRWKNCRAGGHTSACWIILTHEYTQRLVASVPRLPEYANAAIDAL